jgi:hypothetical protein
MTPCRTSPSSPKNTWVCTALRPTLASMMFQILANRTDLRRSEGYGRTLLLLIGAGTFPLVLDNDLAGTVTAVGSRVVIEFTA